MRFMDNLERRLKEDAAKIEFDVSEALSVRIDAALRSVERARPETRTGRSGVPPWWLSGLTGAAVALLLIALFNRSDTLAPDVPDEPPVATVVPEYRDRTQSEFPLRAETAVSTEPLEEELEKLKTDLERARKNLEEDLRRSF